MTKLVALQSHQKNETPLEPGTGTKLAKRTWDLVPEGEYVGTFKGYEEKQSKTGNLYLSTRFEVEVGEARDKRSIYVKFMLSHPNPKTLEGAAKKLHVLAKILGAQNTMEDTSELNALLDKKCILQVVIKEGKPPYSDYNDVKRFISY